MTRVVVGIDIGGTNIRIGVVTMQYQLLKFTILPSRQMLKEEMPVKLLQAEISKLLEQEEYELVAISLGVPSLINDCGTAPISTPNLKNLDHQDLITPLRKSFFCDVYLNKDSNLLMLHEVSVNKIKREETAIGIFFGTGIGNGVWVNGKLLKGRNAAACELGHIPAWKSEKSCSCGNQGCIESIASGKYLQEICKQEFSDMDISEVFAEKWPHPALLEFVQSMSLPVATEINIFNPDYIILGGGIIYMNHFPLETLIAEIKKRVRKPVPAENIKILYSQCKQETGVLGAAIYALDKLKEGREKHESEVINA